MRAAEAAVLEKIYSKALAEAAKLDYKLKAKVAAKSFLDEAKKEKARKAEKLKLIRQAGLIWIQEMQNLEKTEKSTTVIMKVAKGGRSITK